jgi:hypothetical protein
VPGVCAVAVPAAQDSRTQSASSLLWESSRTNPLTNEYSAPTVLSTSTGGAIAIILFLTEDRISPFSLLKQEDIEFLFGGFSHKSL